MTAYPNEATGRIPALIGRSDLIDLICQTENGTCAVCDRYRLVVRVSTDDQSDPAFCRSCLIGMANLAEDAD